MTSILEAEPIIDRSASKVHLPEKLTAAGRVGRTGVWVVLLVYGLLSVVPMVWLLIAPSKTAAQLNNPSAVVVDSLGNLLIADTYNSRIRKVGTNGIITTFAGTGTFGYSGDGGAATKATLFFPSGIALSAAGRGSMVAPPVTWRPHGIASSTWNALPVCEKR